jgi:anti-sigma regulatory factor (Ser/Thr protein kinase)
MEAHHGGPATAPADHAPLPCASPLASPPAGPPLWLNVPARPGQLAGLRRALREWMAQAGIGAEEAAAIQQAVGEATTNAVEHAYAGADPGLVLVTAEVDDGSVLTVKVTDSGRWRQPAGDTPRGRGLSLMRACMDEVQVTSAEDGTTVVMRRELGHRPG